MKRALQALALLALMGSAEAAEPRGKPVFIDLPTGALPADVGANGFVVVGNFYGGAGGFTWMPTHNVAPIGGAVTATVSRDGKSIAGSILDAAGHEIAAVWTGGREWRTIGTLVPNAASCDRYLSSVYGGNDDGSVLVGLGWNGCKIAHAFRWEQSTGMVDLGAANVTSSRANSVSGDGRVVIGWVEHSSGFRQGARWVDRKQEILRGPSDLLGEAFGTNRDGSLIVGANCDPYKTGGGGGWVWTEASGVQCFPVEKPSRLQNIPYITYMMATSEDGRVIGGSYTFGLEAESLIWFDGKGFFLRDYLRANGLPDAFNGWVNTGFVTSVSPDGRTIVGYGAGPTGFQGFMILLPEMGAR
jgi:probable HAF family extracellular repeat protein